MRILGIAAVTGLFLSVSQSPAQFFVGPGGGALVTGGGFSLNFHSSRFNAAFVARTSIVSYGAFSGGFYGYSGFHGYRAPWYGISTVVVVPPPIIVVQPIIVPVQAQQVNIPDADRFIVIRPNPAPALAPPPARVEKMPKEVELGIVPAELPLARGPALDKRVEADRQIENGKAAFGKGQYGRAIESFSKLTQLLPDNAAGWFFLAQAQFAGGKYDDATASIITGMKRQPDWPLSNFRSRALYRANPVVFDMHLLNLQNALKTDPADPRLLFLLGVELWFDGQGDDAKPLFEKAALLAKDPAPAEAFAKAKK